MFKNHPKGLVVLALANMGERFGYYTMLAILTLYMQAKFGFTSAATSMIYGTFLAIIYFFPVFGGVLADKVLGYGKTILLGMIIMFAGKALMSIPVDNNPVGQTILFSALLLIAVGTGFFKGNLQALVGKMYDDPRYSKNRDIAFSIFYMFINIGAFFAPIAADAINNQVLKADSFTYNAGIPANFVTLNDEANAVDKSTFVAQHLSPEEQQLTGRAYDEAVLKAKKSQKAIFTEDITNALFNLKAAGLNQLTQFGKITDPAMMISNEDYEVLQSRNPAEAEQKAAVREKIGNIHVTDAELYGGANPDDFARNFGSFYVSNSLSRSYNLAYVVAALSVVFSLLIFVFFRKTWKSYDRTAKQEQAASEASGKEVKVMPKSEVRERMIALFLVFFVVIFFWMSFHQNGLTMTFFARDYTASVISPAWTMLFNMLPLLAIMVFLYGVYLSTIGLLGGKPNKKTGILLTLAGLLGLIGYYMVNVRGIEAITKITPQIFQQFNPMFIIILTPLTVAMFGYLAKRKKEPSAPRKIGIGMLIAALGFVVLLVGSIGLPAPAALTGVSDTLVSPGWLIGTYFVLTIAELFLSPMGLSFVSKVAPPQYSGLMQGGWLAATAIGNLLVGVMGIFWDKMSLVAFWGVLIACCLLSAVFIFSIMKRLERATN
ncbi:MAG: peptide MFS transporter [Bacteroidia bacterium]|nr:peptide MFS transporter [Bacteroidia bacterium]